MSAALAAAGSSSQFVTFWVQEEVFGVLLSEVQEIIRMPQLVRVPMAAPTLEGIANLRGEILPIVSLRRMFYMVEIPHDDATRVVIINNGELCGYVIDRMASVITSEQRDIEPMESASGTIRSDLLHGMIKRPEGPILLLKLPSLGGRIAANDTTAPMVVHRSGVSQAGDPPVGRTASGNDTNDILQLVSFVVADEEYAFPIEDVQEIVQVPARICSIPRSDAHVIGVMTLRNRLLPLVSLRRMFRLEQPPLAEHHRIVVVSTGAASVGPVVSIGIIMDAVNEVLRVSRSTVEAVPALLANQDAGTEIESICRLGGSRLVTVLSAERMFPAGLRDRLLAAADAAQHLDEHKMEQQGTAEAASDEEQFVVFLLGGEEFGVPIDAVQEIVRVPEQLTRIPKTPDFIRGVVNLRGVVLPVVDQRRRFGLPEMVRNDRQRIMVLTVGQVRTGFIVDSVLEVLKVPRISIGPAPRLSAEQHLLIDRVANLEARKRMLMLMRPDRLLSIEEQSATAEL